MQQLSPLAPLSSLLTLSPLSLCPVWTAALALPVLLLLAACANPPLEMPSPLAALPDEALTRSAILEGMARRGWTVEREEPGSILATWERPRKTAKVWIDYDLDRVRFRYGGSRNFECEPTQDGASCQTIHPRYGKYLSGLRLDIGRALARKRAELPPPEPF